MNKELVYRNMVNLIENGFFIDKYIELTTKQFNLLDDDSFLDDTDLDGFFGEKSQQENNEIESDNDVSKIHDEYNKYLEDISARIFNAVIIGCQLFDDEEIIKKFVDKFSSGIDPYYLEQILPEFGISNQEALQRLNHGFVVHFTTTRICEEIQKRGKLVGAGKNAMFSEEENKIIDYAEHEQKKNDSKALEKLNYLFRGWGTGVSSYGSTTNGFWMYHTPESLTFLFGDISKRNKEDAMKSVLKRISSLNEDDQKLVFSTMSNIYDRLIGEEQNVSCVLIDRDAFEYEIDYYYESGKPVGVERRPFSTNFSALLSNDSMIKGDIDASNLKFLKIPTILELERQKKERLKNNSSLHRL